MGSLLPLGDVTTTTEVVDGRNHNRQGDPWIPGSYELSIQETIDIVIGGFLGYLMLICFFGRLYAVHEKARLFCC